MPPTAASLSPISVKNTSRTGRTTRGQIDPHSGRIYRLRGKAEPLEKDANLEEKSSRELIKVLSHPNLWHRHTAARLLGQRAEAEVVPNLIAELRKEAVHPAVDALWALHQMNALSEDLATETLMHRSPVVRSWAIRLSGDAKELSGRMLDSVCSVASAEQDAEVRCQILSTAGRLPVDQALKLVQSIWLPDTDTSDPFIPLMLWFVIESHCAENAERVLTMFEEEEFWSRPVIEQHVIERLMRRFAEGGTRSDFLNCARLLELAPSPQAKEALLNGFEKAFSGRIPPQLPEELIAATGRGSLSMRIRQGDESAIGRGLSLLAENKPERLEAIRAFGTRAVADAQEKLIAIATGATDLMHRRAALNSLQIYRDAAIAKALAASYAEQPDALRPSILNLLASRQEWAAELVRSGTIPKDDLTDEIRARIALHDPELSSTQAEPTAIQVAEQAEAITTILRAKPGDAYKGEPLYSARCGACHKLFFKGGEVGPDLTRYQRDDLATMLVSILDPNAEIREGYETIVAKTVDDRILSGFLAEDDANTIVLRSFEGSNTTLARKDIATLTPAGRSLMPHGLLSGLNDHQLRDLFAYLRISQPITR